MSSSLDSARATVAELTEAAKRCAPTQQTTSRPSAVTRFETKLDTQQQARRYANPETFGSRHRAGGAELLMSSRFTCHA